MFETPIEIAKLADILVRLNEITPETNLQVSLKNNEWITKIAIFPAVPVERTAEMEKLAKDFEAKLEM